LLLSRRDERSQKERDVYGGYVASLLDPLLARLKHDRGGSDR
jgi:hypothetical protein